MDDTSPAPARATTPALAGEGDGAVLPYARAKEQALSQFEQEYVEARMAACGGNISAAARQAGMDRSNFKRLLRKYRRDAEAESGPDDELAIG